MIRFFTILFTVFIAEMGDKTQLMLVAMTAKYKTRHIVLGTAAAIVVLNIMAVGLGGLVGDLVPAWLIKLVAALAFFYFAYSSLHDLQGTEEEHKSLSSKVEIVAVFMTFFVAEFGDKTQLTAITFGASSGLEVAPFVCAACCLGLFLSDMLGLVVGLLLKRQLNLFVLKVFASLIFAVFGAATLFNVLFLLAVQDAFVILLGALAVYINLCYASMLHLLQLHCKTPPPNKKSR